MNKRNFDQLMQAAIAAFSKQGRKPRLLLHVCCAPCSSAVLERLHDLVHLLVYFDNPNLDSEEEFDKRVLETQRLVEETSWAQGVIVEPYTPDVYQEVIRGLEEEPEGGLRCQACFRLRLHRAALAAREHGCDFFTTTLTISPRKDASLLNALGEEAGESAGVPFLPSDFKKQDGFLRSVQLSREHDLYRQDYCGCAFSKREREERR